MGPIPSPRATALHGFPQRPVADAQHPHRVKETPEAHVYKAHLPGYRQNDVRVEVDDGRVLCIVCGKSAEKEEQRGGWHRVELASGHFVQRLTLPENSMGDHVKAYMDSGVLTITVPKHNRGVNSRVRNINVSSRP
ncbi:18.1 kDa class I heat shock protein [Spatholobus suberectus]|nr:18.1 kDa class I heat shock protein [Spatholobus suberectus]